MQLKKNWNPSLKQSQDTKTFFLKEVFHWKWKISNIPSISKKWFSKLNSVSINSQNTYFCFLPFKVTCKNQSTWGNWVFASKPGLGQGKKMSNLVTERPKLLTKLARRSEVESYLWISLGPQNRSYPQVSSRRKKVSPSRSRAFLLPSRTEMPG